MAEKQKIKSKLFPDLNEPVKQEPKLGKMEWLKEKVKKINRLMLVAIIFTLFNIVVLGSIKDDTKMYEEKYQEKASELKQIEIRVRNLNARIKKAEEQEAENAERKKLSKLTPEERESLKAKEEFENERSMSVLLGNGLLYRVVTSDHMFLDREVVVTKAMEGEPDRYLDNDEIYIIIDVEVRNRDSAIIRVRDGDFELIVNKLVVERDVVFNESTALEYRKDILPDGKLSGSVRFSIDSSFIGTIPIWYGGTEIATIIVDGYGRN